MEIKLPTSGHTVTLKKYVSQDLHEELQLIGSELLGGNTGEAIRLRLLNVEQIGDELGTDRMMEIQNAETEEQREVLLNEARAELIGKKMNLTSTVGSTHKLDRARTKGMIAEVKSSEGKILFTGGMMKGIGDWIGDLPAEDYQAISSAAERIVEAQQERMGKQLALSDESSQASKSPAPKTEPEAAS